MAETEKKNHPARDSDKKTIPEDAQLNLEDLILQRVRLAKRTHMPVESAPTGLSEMEAPTQDQKLSMWMPQGKGATDSQEGQPRGGHRGGTAKDKQKREGSPDSPSSWSSRRNDWNYE